MLQTFDFPSRQGRELSKKTEATMATLQKHAEISNNKSYGKRVGLMLKLPDSSIGFRNEYLSGTHNAQA